MTDRAPQGVRPIEQETVDSSVSGSNTPYSITHFKFSSGITGKDKKGFLMLNLRTELK